MVSGTDDIGSGRTSAVPTMGYSPNPDDEVPNEFSVKSKTAAQRQAAREARTRFYTNKAAVTDTKTAKIFSEWIEQFDAKVDALTVRQDAFLRYLDLR